jgi:plasmid stabilization system protein ParE
MKATYAVVLTEQAACELEAAADWWAAHRSVPEAARWYGGFSARIESLRQAPKRCPVADESPEFSYELRELHFGLGSVPTHRAIYTVGREFVVVLTIRHEAQKAIRPDDIRSDVKS